MRWRRRQAWMPRKEMIMHRLAVTYRHRVQVMRLCSPLSSLVLSPSTSAWIATWHLHPDPVRIDWFGMGHSPLNPSQDPIRSKPYGCHFG
jgi:hypothetical protein